MRNRSGWHAHVFVGMSADLVYTTGHAHEDVGMPPDRTVRTADPTSMIISRARPVMGPLAAELMRRQIGRASTVAIIQTRQDLTGIHGRRFR